MHGDNFDGIVQYARWLAFLGDRAYNLLLIVNHWYNLWRRWLGYPYWSLSAHLKRKVKNAVELYRRFRACAGRGGAQARRRRRHLRPYPQGRDPRRSAPILYCNDGDWVESCTALVEHRDGRLEILEWASLRSSRC